MSSEKDHRIENLFQKIMTKKLPEPGEGKSHASSEAQRVPIKTSPKRPTPKHIIIKMPNFKDKERILEAGREKWIVAYKGAPARLASDFSTETL